MKVKQLLWLLVLSFLFSISSVMAADVFPFTLGTIGSATAQWTTSEAYTGSYSVNLETNVNGDYAYMWFDPIPATIDDINSLSFYYKHSSYNTWPGPRIGLLIELSGQYHLAISGTASQSSSWLQADGITGNNIISYGPDQDDIWWYGDCNNAQCSVYTQQGGPVNFSTIQTNYAGASVENIGVYMGVVDGVNVGTGEAYIDDLEVNGVVYYGKIQDAIDAANPTDTINVSTGTYIEELTINKSLSLIGDPGNSPGPGPNPPILDGGGAVGSAITIAGGVSDVTIQGFEIRNYTNSGLSGGIGSGVLAWNSVGTSNIKVLDNYFHDLGWSAVLVGNEGQSLNDNWLVKDNIISNVAFYSIELTNTKNSEVIDNIVTGGINVTYTPTLTENSDDGILIQSQVHTGGGVTVNNVTAHNNIVNGTFERAGIEILAWDSTNSLTAQQDDINISDNSVSGAERGMYIFSVGANANIDNLNINKNILDGNDDGIQIRDIFGGTHGLIDIKDNEIINSVGTSSGVHIRSGTSTSKINVNFNNIVGNALMGINNEGIGILNGTFNYWGSCDGPSGVGPGSGDAVSVNVTYQPWIGICIENKTDVTCKYETNNITLEANLTSLLNINKVWMTYTIDGTNHNKTASNTQGDIYSAVINSAELVGGQNITWNVYANDTFGNVFSNGMKIFYVINRTSLVVDPFAPNGLNNWYVTEPLFSLIKDPTGGNMFYQWDSDDIYTYTVPFGLENIPNAPPIESAGTLELNWWTDFGVCGNEPINTELFYVDLKNPEITDLKPENNSVVYNNLKPKISAYLDDVYQSNSGIDTEIVQMSLNGNMVIPTVNTTDTLDAIVSYTPTADLDTGKHNVTVNVTDVAGRSTESTWFFEINITPVFSMVIHSPQNDVVYGSRRVPFNITSSENLELIEYIDWSLTTPRWRKLCDDCDEYGSTREKTISFSEGEHIVTIRATDYKDQIAEINVSFSVDGRSPRILKTLPRRNKFTNGSDFYIKYTEANLKEVSVTFNPTIVLADCTESGVNKECTIDLNSELIPFDNQTITYWFNVSDDVRNVISRKIDVHVDTTKPVLNNPDSFYTIDGRYVEFNMSITEDNLDRVEYIDYEASNPQYRTLCSRLKDSMCERKKSFSRGNHALDVRVKDKAGNSIIMEGIEFEV